MQKTWNWKSVIRLLAISGLTLIAVLLLSEMWNAWTVPGEYPFAAQGPAAAMWSYRSQSNYLLACFGLWLGCLLAIWALLAHKCDKRLRWMCAIPLLTTWTLMAVDGSRLAY